MRFESLARNIFLERLHNGRIKRQNYPYNMKPC
jgi:hypothetical protein